MFNDRIQIGRDLLNVPMGEMIKDMAFAIAEAQMKLDTNSMEVAEMMGGLKSDVNSSGATIFTDSRVYFGQQKVTKSLAVDLYNSTTDSALKGSIKELLASNGDDDDSTSDDAYIIDESATTDPGKMILQSNTDVTDTISVPQKVSMLELGFTPTFYQFVDTIIEVKINIKYTAEQSSSRGYSASYENKTKTKNRSGWFFSRNRRKNKTTFTSQTNATFSQKFSYSAEGSSLLRTKLVPIPPPAILEERIQQLMEDARADS